MGGRISTEAALPAGTDEQGQRVAAPAIQLFVLNSLSFIPQKGSLSLPHLQNLSSNCRLLFTSQPPGQATLILSLKDCRSLAGLLLPHLPLSAPHAVVSALPTRSWEKRRLLCSLPGPKGEPCHQRVTKLALAQYSEEPVQPELSKEPRLPRRSCISDAGHMTRLLWKWPLCLAGLMRKPVRASGCSERRRVSPSVCTSACGLLEPEGQPPWSWNRGKLGSSIKIPLCVHYTWVFSFLLFAFPGSKE